jgi:hypothetical protein
VFCLRAKISPKHVARCENRCLAWILLINWPPFLKQGHLAFNVLIICLSLCLMFVVYISEIRCFTSCIYPAIKTSLPLKIIINKSLIIEHTQNSPLADNAVDFSTKLSGWYHHCIRTISCIEVYTRKSRYSCPVIIISVLQNHSLSFTNNPNFRSYRF